MNIESPVSQGDIDYIKRLNLHIKDIGMGLIEAELSNVLDNEINGGDVERTNKYIEKVVQMSKEIIDRFNKNPHDKQLAELLKKGNELSNSKKNAQ